MGNWGSYWCPGDDKHEVSNLTYPSAPNNKKEFKGAAMNQK